MIIRSSRVVLPDGVRPASIHIEHGRIAAISGDPNGEDFGDLVISPGIVDTHVHINEPGRSEWEGFDTATRAAAAGGVTTVVDMPLNSIPATTTVASLNAKRAAARGHVHVDVGFWGGVVPGNAVELDALIDAGVRGFKCFLAPSGVEEFQHVSEADLRLAMPILARRNVPLLVHAEDPALLRKPTDASSDAYATYLASRPPEAERSAIDMMIRLAREFGTHVHIVHVACKEAVEAIAAAKMERLPISAETCPHYLTFTAESIPSGATEYKCSPPIRDGSQLQALWSALHLGLLDCVATDHSPAPPSKKPRGNFESAWGGIASLELSLAAVWTAQLPPPRNMPFQRALSFVPFDCRPIGPEHIALWMSAAPARLAHLDRKGRIGVGFDADLMIWDPDAQFTVDPAKLQQRHKLTPYAGRRLRGLVKTTFLRGERIWDDGALARSQFGQLL